VYSVAQLSAELNIRTLLIDKVKNSIILDIMAQDGSEILECHASLSNGRILDIFSHILDILDIFRHI
jgi:hypothetical protein